MHLSQDAQNTSPLIAKEERMWARVKEEFDKLK